MKNNISPKIDLLEALYEDLYDSLRGDLIGKLIIDELNSNHKFWHDLHDGFSLKVEKNSLPDLYKCLQEVTKTLKFEEKVDLYIVNDSEVNAYSKYSFDPECPHIVLLNSSLVQILSENELKYVIGHEIGHLINGDANINALVSYLYKDLDCSEYPTFIRMRKKIFNQLSELSADRYGYLACESLDTSIAAEYKITAGLDIAKFNINIAELVRSNEELAKFFFEGKGKMTGDHPVWPIRIHALQIFANAKSQEELDEQMYQIFSCYYNPGELDLFLLKYAAIAGLYMANRDGHVTNDERSHILNTMGMFDLYPNDVLAEIEGGDINQAFEEIINEWSETPDYRCLAEEMLDYFIDVAFYDREITEEEMVAIFELGKRLDFSFDEIAAKIADKIRNTCIPKTL